MSLKLNDSAINRVKEIISKPENSEKFLRISVSSGGCNGFQYIFELDDKLVENDIKILEEGKKTIAATDESSISFLNDAQIEFVEELGANYFKVTNPNASQNCGCGSSFSV